MKEFRLDGVNLSDFLFNGNRLCELTHPEFVNLIPKDPGDIFWTHLELLRKCKFVGKYPLTDGRSKALMQQLFFFKNQERINEEKVDAFFL